jgi:hypothetical protein
MNHAQAKETLDKIVGQIFGYQNPYTLEQFMQKYAFDVRLPVQVNDATTGEATWSQSVNPTRFITMKNSHDRVDGFQPPKRTLSSIQDVLAAWNEVNLTTTERQIESLNVAESDNIYNSENVFRSEDIHRSKNILFSDGLHDSEFIVASQRSQNSAFCARIEDSGQCSNSFSVVWSSKVVNSMFIQDCFDMYECMFCAHMTSRKFCIANMQFEEAEYRQLKDMLVKWILTS